MQLRNGIMTALLGFVLLPMSAGPATLSLAATNIVNEDNHLVCFKAKDAVKPKLKGTTVDVLVERFATLTNCSIKKMAEYCVSAFNNVTDEGDGLDPQAFEPGDLFGPRQFELNSEFACFKFKCDKVDALTADALSQFGVHQVEVGKPGKICLPTFPETCGSKIFLADTCQSVFDETACDSAWHLNENDESTSCFWAPNQRGGGSACFSCGPENEAEMRCDNSCTEETIPACEDDGLVQRGSCHDFDGDESGCENAYQLSERTRLPVSCSYGPNTDSNSSTNCSGCGPTNQAGGFCTNACSSEPVPSCADGGRSFLENCHEAGDEGDCNTSWEVDGRRFLGASCWWDSATLECESCNVNSEFLGQCANVCAAP